MMYGKDGAGEMGGQVRVRSGRVAVGGRDGRTTKLIVRGGGAASNVANGGRLAMAGERGPLNRGGQGDVGPGPGLADGATCPGR